MSHFKILTQIGILFRRLREPAEVDGIRELAKIGVEEEIFQILQDHFETISSSVFLYEFKARKINLAAGAKVIGEAKRAEREGRELMLFLSGGSSLRALELLAQEGWRELINWKKVQIFFADERAEIPLDDKENNAHLAYELILDTLIKEKLLPSENVHRIDSTKEPYREALAYEYEIEKVLKRNPRIFAVLGMGADGHTASIFSDYPWEDKVLPLRWAWFVSGKTQPNKLDKITLTPYFLQNIVENMMFVITGSTKAQTLAQVLNALKLSDQNSPFPIVKVLLPARGRTLIFADSEALEVYRTKK